MNAKEARERASQFNVSKKSNYAQIILEIKQAASKGEYHIFIYDPVDDDARKKLTDDGYAVSKTEFDRNELITKITW